MPLEILFDDPYFLAINKPPNLLVHQTRLSEDTTSVLQILRDQIGQWLYTIHRLDRGTSGVLIIGKTPEAAGALAEHWRERAVEKKYLAVVRGYIAAEGTIDYALSDPETGKPSQPAVTHWRKLAETEIDVPIGLRYPQARYSLVEAEPETGRRQQIRKHFAHLRHPILGDKRHGDNKHNMYWQEHFDLQRMLLHAARLGFTHPFTGERIELEAGLDAAFLAALQRLQLEAAALAYLK
jgi:tRNA pseudouridine65 synthase